MPFLLMSADHQKNCSFEGLIYWIETNAVNVSQSCEFPVIGNSFLCPLNQFKCCSSLDLIAVEGLICHI